MFAPDPYSVAREMVRITRLAEGLSRGNWIRNDPAAFVFQLLKIGSAYQPPPPEGFNSPMAWGVEEHLVNRLSKAGVSLENDSMRRDTFYFTSAKDTPARWVDALLNYNGPTMNANDDAQQSGREGERHQQVVAQPAAQNKSEGGNLHIPAAFMKVTIQL